MNETVTAGAVRLDDAELEQVAGGAAAVAPVVISTGPIPEKERHHRHHGHHGWAIGLSAPNGS
ncbi:hypothetical protein [Kitasatospora sp. NPDC093102]|uniref:hypothetical protein n=1 Tax=Kitasatospora sp. NPDC093102 TaxID=3155069 RepID=UPI00341902DE